MSISKTLFGFVDHVSSIIDGSGGKRFIYSIIHNLVVILTFFVINYGLGLLFGPKEILQYLIIIVLIPVTIGLVIESIFMVIYQVILFFINFKDIKESKALFILNIIMTLIMAVFLWYAADYLLNL